MQRTQICRWFLVPAILVAAVCIAIQGVSMERDVSWPEDPRSLATSTRGLEEFLPKGDYPQPGIGFGALLGSWTWAEIGIPCCYGGAGISIDYPYLYLCNQSNDSTYVVDVSSGAPESVVAVFESPGSQLCWGAGIDGRSLLWLGDVNESSHSWVYEMSVFPPMPTPTGESLNTAGPSMWMADIADNSPGDTIFQLGVGQMDSAQNNRIYAIHVPTGTVGRILSDSTWAYVSQRGLTYNSDCGTFFVGGWNSRAVWEISYADGAPIPGRHFGASDVSGLAYQDSSCDGAAKLWIQNNDWEDLLSLIYIGPCSPLAVEESGGASMERASSLCQNSPNPFSQSTVISYSLPSATRVTLAVRDISGRLVETLVNEIRQPGVHQVLWNRKTNPSGVYFYRLRAGEVLETRKMVAVE